MTIRRRMTLPSDLAGWRGLWLLDVVRFGNDFVTVCRGCDAMFENGSFPHWLYGETGLCPQCQELDAVREATSPDGNVTFTGEVDPMDLPSIRYGGMNVDALRLEVIELERQLDVEWWALDEDDYEALQTDLEEAYPELERVERNLGVVRLRRVV